VPLPDETQVIKALKSGYYQVIVNKNECVSPQSEKFYYTITNVKEDDKPLIINIFPNPAKNEFYIEITNPQPFLKASISDMYGKRVNHIPLNPTNEKLFSQKIMTNGFSKGLYFLKIENGHSTIIKKLIIE
jgi:hypothetical protein